MLRINREIKEMLITNISPKFLAISYSNPFILLGVWIIIRTLPLKIHCYLTKHPMPAYSVVLLYHWQDINYSSIFNHFWEHNESTMVLQNISIL